MKGYIHVYTGEGKGKTTAALGLAIRAAGAGFKVFIGQFIKGKEYSELKALKRFDDLITVEQYGLGRFINGKVSPADIEAAKVGLEKLKSIVSSGEYNVIILDEANVALKYDLFPLQDFLDLIDSRAPETELIITGRHAAPEIIEKADLVSEIKAVKHYFKEGVNARVGIEK